jgi:decaprenylphospho-beta-D-ribofuranose 2-oxidase
MRKNFTQFENFGRSLRTPSYLIKINMSAEIHEAFNLAKRMGLSVAARGAGRSYNDASLNGGGIILDMRGMNAITQWNKSTGEITVQPGVTIEQLWQKVEPDGWWPPVVSGTMKTTLGGCLSTNIHGKNNFKMGPIGEHVLEFTAILPAGVEVTCSPKRNADLFYAMIGGLGMLGIFTSVTLQMKRIHSGLMTVTAWPVHNLHGQLSSLLDHAPNYDYIVGWLDPMAGGKSIGRGQIHGARCMHEDEDQNSQETMKLEKQIVSSRFLGIFPGSMVQYFMSPFINNLGMWGINTGKYITSLYRHSFRQSHGSFHFLLDYVPLFSYGGLIQYQSFIPKATAETAWIEMLELSHRYHAPSYLGVIKRHRPDKFLLTHAVDGFSLAMDFKITSRNRRRLSTLLQDFDKIVLQAGGRFYFAKNSETTAETALAFYGRETLNKYRKLKKRCDPDGLLQSDLYRRMFGG